MTIQFARGDLSRFIQARKDLDQLRKMNPQQMAAVRKKQDYLCAFLLDHAEALLELALARLDVEQCAACIGHGFTVEWVASDEQRRHNCRSCKGTGLIQTVEKEQPHAR